MSDPTKTHVLYQLLDVVLIDADPECDVVAVSVQGNGEMFTVTCAGPKGMKSNAFINAMRVATAGLIRAVGGDMSVVGCGTPDHAQFDTGDQRAN